MELKEKLFRGTGCGSFQEEGKLESHDMHKLEL